MAKNELVTVNYCNACARAGRRHLPIHALRYKVKCDYCGYIKYCTRIKWPLKPEPKRDLSKVLDKLDAILNRVS